MSREHECATKFISKRPSCFSEFVDERLHHSFIVVTDGVFQGPRAKLILFGYVSMSIPLQADWCCRVSLGISHGFMWSQAPSGLRSVASLDGGALTMEA